MGEQSKIVETADELSAPVILGPEAYISADYARAERDLLWRKVWLQAGRAEDVPEVGNFITYDILDDSVLIVRTKPGNEPGAIQAYGDDPDRCVFEAAVYELYPEGEAPETEWEYTERGDWPSVLQQDFANMAAVQRGMKSGGFRGAQPNPYMERAVPSLHWNLARYMGHRRPAKVPLT